MKTIIFFCFVLALSNCLLLQSCCTKVYCVAILNEVELRGFSTDSIDSVTVYRSYFNTTLIDTLSLKVTKSLYNEQVSFYLPNDVENGYTYTIQIKGYPQMYILSDFVFEGKGCNSCFPYRPKDDYYKAIAHYQLNGSTIYGGPIYIQK